LACVTVAASALQYKNQKDTANKQDRNLAAQLRSQAATREQASSRTQQLIQQQQQQTSQPQETAAKQQYNAALTANKAMSVAPLANVGNVSDAYTKAADAARQGISTYGADRAANVAAIEAPVQMRRDNVRNIDQYGQDLNTMWRNQRGQDFLSNLKLQGIHQNPWMNMLASGMKAYAGAAGGSGGGAMTGGGGGGDPWGSADVSSGTLPSYPMNGLGGNAPSPWLQRVYGGG
jgi:hypothetical protein